MNLDYQIFNYLYSLFPHNLFFEWIFLIISTLGQARLIWPVLVIGFLLFHKRKIGWIILEASLAMGIGSVLNELLLKNIFERQRPFTIFFNIPNLDTTATGFSLPSSHALAAFSIATVLFLGLKKKWIGILFFVLAILISYSRIYLGVHFPLDVLAGALLGIFFGWIFSKYFPKFYKPLFDKHKK